MDYYLHEDNQRLGPFTIHQLQSRGLRAETQIWHVGLSDWARADQVAELRDSLSDALPPPLELHASPYASPRADVGGPTGRSHSGLGIASFVLGVIVAATECVSIGSATYLASAPDGMNEESPTAIVLGLVVCGGLAVNLLGVGLAIGGLLQRGRKQLFSILGRMALPVAVVEFTARRGRPPGWADRA